MIPVLEAKNLVKEYKKTIGRGKFRALNNLSFKINEGEFFGLIGPNGAGKTTLIKTILNLIFPSSGEVSILGHNVKNVSLHKKIGYVPEISNLYQYLNPTETLRFYGKLSGLRGKALRTSIQDVLEKVKLEHVSKVPIRFFSKGMQQRLNLAQALLHNPPILILDEPVSGLDPLARVEIRTILFELKKNNKTILISSHELSEIETLCTHVGLLYGGEFKHLGQLNSLLELKEGQKESLEQFYVRMIQKNQ